MGLGAIEGLAAKLGLGTKAGGLKPGEGIGLEAIGGLEDSGGFADNEGGRTEVREGLAPRVGGGPEEPEAWSPPACRRSAKILAR